MAFVNKHSLVSQYQCGFKRGKTTADAVLQLVESISDSLNKKSYSLSVFVDLRKAFDMVVHEVLLSKLYLCGIRRLCRL